jgi:outer membrane protein assembly factor BamB
MAGNCSTRDGRARVPAPSSPQVKWTTKAPVAFEAPVTLDDPMGSSIATDADGHAYLVWQPPNDDLYEFARVDTPTGTLEWTTSYQSPTGFEAVPTPLLPASGLVQMVAGLNPALATYNLDNGGASKKPLGVASGFVPPDPPIGRDGSLYLEYITDPRTGGPSAVACFGADGTLRWKSADAAVLTQSPPDSQYPLPVAPLALALDGSVLFELAVGVGLGASTAVVALDPSTGSARWEKTLPAGPETGIAVGADGSIAFATVSVTPAGDTSYSLVVLEPNGDVRHTVPLGGLIPLGLSAVSPDGTVIFRTQQGRAFGIAAVSASGQLLWQERGNYYGATLASNDTIVTFGDVLAGLDVATGATKWSVASPTGGPLCNAALTSSFVAGSGTSGTIYGIVAFACDGTLFEVGD